MDLNDLDDLPTDDLKVIFVHVQDVLGRRSVIESAPGEVRSVVAAYVDAGGDPADLSAVIDESPAPPIDALAAITRVQGV